MGIERILVVDDEALSREFLTEALKTLHFETISAATAEEALVLAQKEAPDLVLSDLKMPGMDGIQFMQKMREACPDTPFILLTAYGTVESAVAAMKHGASDFLLKPVSADALEIAIRKAQQNRKLHSENEYLRREVQGTQTFIGNSTEIHKVLEEVKKVARTKATVLITGESGTGKERIAHLVHYNSPRAAKPFVRVNCAALSETLLESELFGHERGAFTGAVQKREGRFELADGGTLLLDEIGEIPMSLQAKLLRVLEEEEFERVGGTKTLKVDVRVIATTNRNLANEVKRGKFREDLFYRLNVVPLHIPALRERRDDIPELAQHFLKHFASQYGSQTQSFQHDAVEKLKQYSWPGNVRELENLIQRLAVRDSSAQISAEDLALDLVLAPLSADSGDGESGDLGKLLSGRTLDDIEREVILNTLDLTGWNKTEAARILGVTARTLSNKLKLYRETGLLKTENKPQEAPHE